MSSQLAQRVAINGLAEHFSAFNTNYHDTGLWGIYANAPKDTLEDLSWCIMQDVIKMVYDVSEQDVARARNQLKSVLLYTQSNSQGTE